MNFQTFFSDVLCWRFPASDARRRNLPLLGILLLLLIGSGCAPMIHYPVNEPIGGLESGKGYYFENLAQGESSDKLFFVASFSGGGSRAAALSFGVLEELRETRIRWEGREHPMLDELDLISSVSGGSMIAASLALYGNDFFERFEQNFLKKDIQSEISRRILNPFYWPRISSSRYGRSEIVAEVLDEHLFHGATFADLIASKRRPFLMINATDLTQGSRFSFTQDQFDLLCSDLSKLSIARAVSASAALPIVFSPVSFWNYAGSCRRSIHGLIEANPAESGPAFMKRIAELNSYTDKGRRPYIHLLDGGLVDNVGIQSTLEEPLLVGGPARMLKMMGFNDVQKVIMLVVSAEQDNIDPSDQSADVPGIFRVTQALIDIPINRISANSLDRLRESVQDWKRDLRLTLGRDVAIYLIQADLRQISDPKEREYFMSIPTTLVLTEEESTRLREIGRRLLRNSPDFIRLKRDIGVQP